MIILKENTINSNVTTTFNENITLTGSVYFLWSVISDDTNDSVEFIATDVSTNQFRYNEFTITLTGASDVNLTGGTINLEPLGSWKYNVYQQNSNTNLDVSLADSIIERGRIYVSGATVPSVTAYVATANTNNITYNG